MLLGFQKMNSDLGRDSNLGSPNTGPGYNIFLESKIFISQGTNYKSVSTKKFDNNVIR